MRQTSLPVAIRIMFRREVIRFFRQPSRVIAAVGTTALLWLLLGSGFAESLQPEISDDRVISFGAWLLPGMMTLVAVFSAIFSSLSTIEDRQTGWLQAVLVSPVSRLAIILGRSGGGGCVAFIQSGVLLLAIPVMAISISAGGILLTLLVLAMTSVAMAALGLAFAWRCETASAFHSVMNLVFMPMWLLSGSVFPISGASSWLEVVAWCNPLTWCTTALRTSLVGDPSWSMIGLTAVVMSVSVGLAAAVVSRR